MGGRLGGRERKTEKEGGRGRREVEREERGTEGEMERERDGGRGRERERERERGRERGREMQRENVHTVLNETGLIRWHHGGVKTSSKTIEEHTPRDQSVLSLGDH